MKCPVCVNQNKKSTISIIGSICILAYIIPESYDEEGNYIVNRDFNTYTNDYKCSNDHKFSIHHTLGEEATSIWQQDNNEPHKT